MTVIPVIADVNVPEGTAYRIGEAVYAHPRDVVLVRIGTEPGLSYAQVSTARGLIAMARRRRERPTYEAVRARVAYLDGVRP